MRGPVNGPCLTAAPAEWDWTQTQHHCQWCPLCKPGTQSSRRLITLGRMSTLEPERGTGTGTLVEPTPQTSHGDGDHERFAHYVQKDKIMASALDGTPVVALCGKVWVPGRDPKKYPVCPMCKEIYESMGSGDDEGGDK